MSRRGARTEAAVRDVQRIPVRPDEAGSRLQLWRRSLTQSLELKPFKHQPSIGFQEVFLGLSTFTQLDDRSKPLAGPDYDCVTRDVDWFGDERPIATDLDAVAVAGGDHRVGQGMKPALRNTLAPDDHKRLGFLSDRRAGLSISLSHCSYSGVFFHRS